MKKSPSQKLMFSLTILLIFKNFFELVTSRKLNKNFSPLICLYLLNCCSRGSLWKWSVRTYLYPSLRNSDIKQDLSCMRARDVCFVSENFGQVDHCSIHVGKDNRNSDLLSLQTTAFPSILEVLYCVLALHVSGIKFFRKMAFCSSCSWFIKDWKGQCHTLLVINWMNCHISNFWSFTKIRLQFRILFMNIIKSFPINKTIRDFNQISRIKCLETI